VDTVEVLEFQVADTGIGMNQDEIQLLFKPFSQIDTSYTRNYTGNALPQNPINTLLGSGLGLVICKNLCQLMNGTIWLTSERDKGSTFYFSIPFKIYSESNLQPMVTEDIPIDSSVVESAPYFG
jgi:signal transduction histidine kinase